MGRTPCDTCRKSYEEYEKQPPCQRCFPGVHYLNETAYIVFTSCSSQLLRDSGGAYTIDIRAFDIACDWHEIEKEERYEIWPDVKYIADVMIQTCREEAERLAKIKKGATNGGS